MDSHDHEELVPRLQVAKEFGRSARTITRWERAGVFGFDQPIFLKRNVYHRRSRIEAAKVGAPLESQGAR
ncbi:MAG: hypothetical protein USCAAHI_01434 [Beijerinckiaceae bacterium]|jgi:hypothetical protein|nr:MAG: hypothetical protein USCAAHI_01434 [Beijerinckiaceae bacterium]